MQDRVSQYPGRIKLTPVSGQENVYDMEWADGATVEGTPLNKANLLTDATATAIGLNSSATPNMAINHLNTKINDVEDLATYAIGYKFAIITSSRNFVAPSKITGPAHVLLFGGGGGRNGNGGGGGGHMEEFDITLTPGRSYAVVIGAAGNTGSGGTTTFSGHSASGGSAGSGNNGGDGGSGGGGGPSEGI